MIKRIQYYISNETNPYKNLATEFHLLNLVDSESIILYLWQNHDTVVIGRNQNPWAECNCQRLSEHNVRLARRLSGGGAVFHDLGNLNFTFLCSTENFHITRQAEVIKKACEKAELKAEVTGRNDILADGRKFSGNAFYNSQGKSYHHGTIMVSTDTSRLSDYLTPPPAKLRSKGVKSVKSRVVNLSELNPGLACSEMKDYMLKAFEEVYNMSAFPINLTDSDEISELAEHYSSWEYIYGKTFPFSTSFEDYFDWGYIQLLLDIKEGTISSVQVYTDALEHTLAESISSALTNCKFEKNAVRNKLSGALPEKICSDVLSMLYCE